MEETDEHINDDITVDVAVDATLADQSLIVSKVLASKSELSCNDQVVNKAATPQSHGI